MTNYTDIMLEGTVSFIRRSVTTKGRKYETHYVYIPTGIAKDSAYPFAPGERAHITVDTKNQRLIIEKEKQ